MPSPGIEWETLNQEAIDLYRAGSSRCGSEPEHSRGPVPGRGQYAQAEPLYKRSLAIREKALGPDHPDVAISLGNLAALYRKMERTKEAEALEHRAERIRAIQR